MTVLVTGAAGFLGTYLVRRLASRGVSVRCHARRWESPRKQEFVRDTPQEFLEFVEGDLADRATCDNLVRGTDVIVHVASALTGSVSSLFANNVVAVRRLLAAAVAAQVSRFVHISSLAVYGVKHLRVGSVLDETCPLDPSPHLRDPYSYSKTMQEHVVWEAHQRQGLGVVVVRPGVIYGPGRTVLAGRVGLSLGNYLLRMGGRQRLPYTYVENCAEAIAAAAVTPGLSGVAITVVDDELPTGRRLIKAYRRSGGRVHVIPIPAWTIRPLSWLVEKYHTWSRGMFPQVLSRYKSDAMWKPLRYSNARAKELLGWQPSVSLDEGLKRSLKG